ncbi:WXG100 family type VII secretion target [Streptomyces buecherae]|uniref:WXG100 family type VII secretion target n=1 Tax=Streptomyces buecherae TaxID=2763006 RepID=UPI0033EBC5DD
MAGNLKVTEAELTQLINDLDLMESSLENKIRALNGVVDRIESGWKGSAAGAYNQLQSGVNLHARKIRELLVLIEQAMKMSRDGFSQQELDQLQKFKNMQGGEGGGQSRILDMA